jgi:hypothetical protein
MEISKRLIGSVRIRIQVHVVSIWACGFGGTTDV